jgi:uncharacterized membrane protein
MIFGLALSVGAITLVSSPPVDVPSVLNDIAGFGFSFLILIVIWLRYTRIMSALPLQSRRVINLNIILLFLVSIEPFLFNIVRRPPTNIANPPVYENVTSGLYAVDLGMMFVILGFFSLTLADEEKMLIPKDLILEYRRGGEIYFVGAAFFLVSIIPFLFTVTYLGIPLRYYLWAVPMFFVWVRRRYQNVREPGSDPSEHPVPTSSERRGP